MKKVEKKKGKKASKIPVEKEKRDASKMRLENYLDDVFDGIHSALATQQNFNAKLYGTVGNSLFFVGQNKNGMFEIGSTNIQMDEIERGELKSVKLFADSAAQKPVETPICFFSVCESKIPTAEKVFEVVIISARTFDDRTYIEILNTEKNPISKLDVTFFPPYLNGKWIDAFTEKDIQRNAELRKPAYLDQTLKAAVEEFNFFRLFSRVGVV